MNPELHSVSNDRRDDLTPEHRTMWDLHVIAEFEGAGKLNCLRHGVSSPGFEQHRSNRAAGEDVSNDQLREDI